MKYLFFILLTVAIAAICNIIIVFKGRIIKKKKIKRMESYGYTLECSPAEGDTSLIVRKFVKPGYRVIGYYDIMHIDYDSIPAFIESKQQLDNDLEESVIQEVGEKPEYNREENKDNG